MPAPPPSPKVYLTPQIQKRRDGLAPSLLPESHSANVPNGSGAALTKSYQTSTEFLTPKVRDLENEAEELKYIVDSVQYFVRDLVDEKKKSKDLVSLSFQPQGCTWVAELNPNVGAPGYQIQIQCLAKAGSKKGQTVFMVDTHLVTKDAKAAGSTSLPGYKDAKAVFELTALYVRKGVVKCEFPEFPEGCKGRTFREVYQLNARVSLLACFLFSLVPGYLFVV
jgi:hypothetical protein